MKLNCNAQQKSEREVSLHLTINFNHRAITSSSSSTHTHVPCQRLSSSSHNFSAYVFTSELSHVVQFFIQFNFVYLLLLFVSVLTAKRRFLIICATFFSFFLYFRFRLCKVKSLFALCCCWWRAERARLTSEPRPISERVRETQSWKRREKFQRIYFANFFSFFLRPSGIRIISHLIRRVRMSPFSLTQRDWCAARPNLFDRARQSWEIQKELTFSCLRLDLNTY